MATQDGLLVATKGVVDASTFVARVKAEIHRDRQVDEDAILRAMCSALDWYKSHRFWFNSASVNVFTVEGQAEYLRNTKGARAADELPRHIVRLDYARITVNSSTYPLRRKNWQYLRSLDTATSINGYPEYYAIRRDRMMVYPAPNQDDLIMKLDYVKDVGTPQCLYTGGAWVLADRNGNTVGLTWTSDLLQNAEELIRHRTKADLYANVIIDVERANVCRQQESEALENLVERGNWYEDPGDAIPWY